MPALTQCAILFTSGRALGQKAKTGQAETVLFHTDNRNFFGMGHLRAVATQVVRNSSLIQRCEAGDRRAAEALYLGFWEFVFEFEKAIDARKLPRGPLEAKFGRPVTQEKLLGTARTIRALKTEEFNGIEAAVRAMRREEATHAKHWLQDAENLGLTEAELECATVMPGVRALVDSAYDLDLVRFFVVLAGTEFIAEEISRRLAHTPRFTELFTRKRAIWMEVHMIPHNHGPTHLEIDVDLARAYAPADVDPMFIEGLISETIHLFGHAAEEVERAFVPLPIAAD